MLMSNEKEAKVAKQSVLHYASMMTDMKRAASLLHEPFPFHLHLHHISTTMSDAALDELPFTSLPRCHRPCHQPGRRSQMHHSLTAGRHPHHRYRFAAHWQR